MEPSPSPRPERKTTCGSFPTSVIIPALRSVRQRSSAVEQGTHKPLVGGSIPPAGTTVFLPFRLQSFPQATFRGGCTHFVTSFGPKTIALQMEPCRVSTYITTPNRENGVDIPKPMILQNWAVERHLRSRWESQSTLGTPVPGHGINPVAYCLIVP